MTAHRVGVAAGLVLEYQLLPIVSGPMLPAIQRHYHVRFLYPGFRDVLKCVEDWLRRCFAHLRLQLHCELRRVTSIPVLSLFYHLIYRVRDSSWEPYQTYILAKSWDLGR